MPRFLFRMLLGLGALICLGPGAVGVAAQQSRSPFAVPENRNVPHNYPLALRQLKLKGIVHTEFFRGILVQVGDSKSLTVLQPKARLNLDYGGAQHLFTVTEIGERSVILSSDESRPYEVFFQ